MPQANWIILLHLLAIWMSVVTSLMAGWTLAIHVYVAVPLGFLLWFLGFLLNLRVIRSYRRSPATHSAAQAQKSSQRIAARTVMNLGIAVFFRSWLTMILSGVLIPFYVSAARKRRVYLDYLRTGMLHDAFPDRIPRR